MEDARTPVESVPWKGRDLLMALCLAGLVSVTVLLFISFAWPVTGNHAPETLLPTLWLVEAALFTVAWLFSVRRYHLPWGSLGFRPVGNVPLLILPLLVLLVSMAMTGLYSLVVSHLGLGTLTPPGIPAAFHLTSPLLQMVQTGLVVLWGPLAEETFFRGFLLQGLLSRIGPIGAVGASSLLFALSHGALGLLVPAFLSGLLLGWLFLRARSLWPCFITHSLQNALALSLGI